MQNVLTGKSWSSLFILTTLLTFLNIIWGGEKPNNTWGKRKKLVLMASTTQTKTNSVISSRCFSFDNLLECYHVELYYG